MAVLGCAAASSARADDAAKAVVEKAVKAAGWADLKAMTWKDKGSLAVMDQKLDYTADWAVALPDKYRFALKSNFGGTPIELTLVVNGDKAWESAGGMTREVTGEKLEYVKHQAYLFWVMSLAPLARDKDFTLKTLPDKTGLPAKTETKVKDEFQNWKEVLDEAYSDGWKEEGKRKVFTKLKLVRDGKTLLESELTDQKDPEALDAKLFEKP
jgi:hypothetical protein